MLDRAPPEDRRRCDEISGHQGQDGLGLGRPALFLGGARDPVDAVCRDPQGGIDGHLDAVHRPRHRARQITDRVGSPFAVRPVVGDQPSIEGGTDLVGESGTQCSEVGPRVDHRVAVDDLEPDTQMIR